MTYSWSGIEDFFSIYESSVNFIDFYYNLSSSSSIGSDCQYILFNSINSKATLFIFELKYCIIGSINEMNSSFDYTYYDFYVEIYLTISEYTGIKYDENDERGEKCLWTSLNMKHKIECNEISYLQIRI